MPSTGTLYHAAYLPATFAGGTFNEVQFVNSRGTPLILPLPSNNSLANRPFRLRTAGRISPILNIFMNQTIYFGVSPTISANTSLGTLVVNPASVGYWDYAVDFFWNATSQQIIGQLSGSYGGTDFSQQTNTISNADPNRDSNTFLQSGSPYGFTFTMSVGSNGAFNVVTDVFDLETL